MLTPRSRGHVVGTGCHTLWRYGPQVFRGPRSPVAGAGGVDRSSSNAPGTFGRPWMDNSAGGRRSTPNLQVPRHMFMKKCIEKTRRMLTYVLTATKEARR
jgi:hypothetical protein